MIINDLIACNSNRIYCSVCSMSEHSNKSNYLLECPPETSKTIFLSKSPFKVCIMYLLFMTHLNDVSQSVGTDMLHSCQSLIFCSVSAGIESSTFTYISDSSII